MNRGKRTKVFLNSLCLILAVVLSGCSGGAAPAATGSSAPSQESSANENPYWCKKPAELVLKTYHALADGYENFASSPVGKAIKEKTNITLEIIPQKNDDLLQSLTTDMASGSLPDIGASFASPGAQDFTNLLLKASKEGVFADMSPALSQYAPQLAGNLVTDTLAGKLSLYLRGVFIEPSPKGERYLVPSCYRATNTWVSGWGLYIRGDIAKALKLDIGDDGIGSAENFYKILKAIKAGNFKDVNGNSVYPVGFVQAAWVQAMSAMIRPYEFGGGIKLGIENGKVSGFIESGNAWEAVKWMRKLLAEGLLDPESLTHSYQLGTEKMAQGRYAVFPMYADPALPTGPEYMQALTSTNPEMAFIPLGNMDNYRGKYETVLNRGMEGCYAIFVKKGANLEACAKLMAFLNTKEGKGLVHMGPQGETWNFNDAGFAQFTPEAYKAFMNDSKAFIRKYGNQMAPLNLLTDIFGYDDSNLNIWGGNGDIFFYQSNTEANELRAEYCDGVMPNRTLINKFSLSYYLNSFKGQEQLEPVWNKLSETLIQCYLAGSDEEAKRILDGYVKTLYNSGYGEFLKYLQETYEKNPDEVADYMTDVP